MTLIFADRRSTATSMLHTSSWINRSLRLQFNCIIGCSVVRSVSSVNCDTVKLGALGFRYSHRCAHPMAMGSTRCMYIGSCPAGTIPGCIVDVISIPGCNYLVVVDVTHYLVVEAAT